MGESPASSEAPSNGLPLSPGARTEAEPAPDAAILSLRFSVRLPVSVTEANDLATPMLAVNGEGGVAHGDRRAFRFRARLVELVAFEGTNDPR